MALDESTLKEISVSNGTRFVNYLIDGLIVGSVVTLPLLGYIFSSVNLDDPESINSVGSSANSVQVFAIGGQFLYYFLMEAYMGGRTLGKMVTGSIVVNKQGELATPGNIAGRSLCRFIPFDNISFIFTRGWHDSISDTYVVDKKKWENAHTIEKNIEDINRMGGESSETVAW